LTITVEDLSFRYGDRAVLKGANATFDGKTTAIVGPSGSGKSTLLGLLAGFLTAQAGKISFDGTEIARPYWNRAGDQRVSFVYQDSRLVEFLTVGQNLELAAQARGRDVSQAERRRVLDLVGLAYIDLSRMPMTLSGGEQQRVAIARGVVCGAQVILADEPTGALDATNTDLVADYLIALANDTVKHLIVATHDEAVYSRCATCWQLSDGRLELRA
jgi:putative ABC transport system ATP-binding protein